MKSKAKAGLQNRQNRRLWKQMKKIDSSPKKVDLTKGYRANISLWLCGALLLYLFHIILKINWWVMAAIVVFILLRLPVHRKLLKEKKYQKRRVQEVSMYMDTLLYAFLKEGKIDAALLDVESAFEEGEMKTAICESLRHIHMTFDETEVMKDSLKIIEDKYPSRRVHNIHKFMLQVENYGGEITKNIELLIADKEMWETRVFCSMEEREKAFRDVILSIVSSLMICGFIQHLPIPNMDISTNWFAQIITGIVFVLDDLIFTRAQKYLTYDWIKADENNTDDYYIRKMEEWKSYDECRERKKSFVFAVPLAFISCYLGVCNQKWIAMIGFLITIFLANQHRIGRRLQKNKLVKEIKRAFPTWLMELVLLLQSENVQVALVKSMQSVPGILKQELNDLIARLEINPEDATPYHLFLKSFEIQEIHSAMSMLYAMSAGHGGNSDKQLAGLIERNQRMQDVAEAQRNKDQSAGLYLLFLAPVLTASMKILVDMVVFMIGFLSAVSI